MNPVDVREIAGHPGVARRVRIDEPVPDLKLGLAAVPDETPLTGELLLEGVEEGVFVKGGLSGPLRLTCARCLKEFDGEFALQVGEMFATAPRDDDYPISADKQLDLEPMVRDAVVLAMPFSPLHEPGCLGLCERCGGDRNLGECTCKEEPVDPRWAALEQFSEQQ